ncbi:MAG: DNA mismatch repair endonuclease MutL [Stomatobaculum sp.]|nr:DNA mismatch repair endonuclease MutL [Stomatobaculum sp.]
MNIQLLDNETINKIAAGEVIERPASIVKELTENAIDAGASAVTIEIRDGGQALIRVTDNGCGIPAEEVREAFVRHATSKIRKAEDLTGVQSLGFRGEALSSIAAVCRTEIITKTRSSLTGVRFVIEGGTETSFEEIGAPEGTTVIARDIFFHTPVRRKFLKSPATEAAHVAELAEQLALSHPEISIRFIVNGQNRFSTSGNGSLKDIIYQLYGRETAAALLEIHAENGPFQIKGFLGKPELSRGSRAMEHYCVNGRYIKSSVVAKAIEEGYGNLLMQRTFPVCVLLLNTDPEKVDVNVHPTKREVRFSEPETVFRFVKEAVYDTLHQAELIREMKLTQEKKPVRTAEEKKRPPEPFETRRSAALFGENASSDASSTASLAASPVRQEMKSAAFTAGEQKSATVRVAEPKSVIEKDGQLALFSQENRQSVRLVGEVFDTYWIAEWNDTMYLIDQHAAHEKVNYERFLAAWKNQEVVSQSLMPPLIITLTAREEALVEQEKEVFSALGYEIEHFGGHEYAVRAVPDILPSVMKDALLKDMIGSLSEETGSGIPEMIIEKTASMSCKASIKGNQRISAEEAERLLDEMFRLEDPYNCPHGRPTVIRLTKAELERRFKRTI